MEEAVAQRIIIIVIIIITIITVIITIVTSSLRWRRLLPSGSDHSTLKEWTLTS